MVSPENLLEVKNLVKEYSSLRAVDGISFSIAPGEIVGLLGPNGAGKTTTISMIMGLLVPTSGEIKIFGKIFAENRREILEQMNFSAVYAQLPGNLTVYENLLIIALLYALPNAKEKVMQAIAAHELGELKYKKCGFLSSGEQSRLALAKISLNKPRLLLMDEPSASLDPSASEIMCSRLREYANRERAGILWTSHDMLEIEAVCDRVLFISHGKILLTGKPGELPQKFGKKNLEELFIAVAREPLSLNITAK